MPSSNPTFNSCVCFVVVAFGWIEVALSAIHKLPESSRCPPRSRACTSWALCVLLCTVWHCVALHCTLHTLGTARVAIHLFPPLCPPPCILAVLPIRALHWPYKNFHWLWIGRYFAFDSFRCWILLFSSSKWQVNLWKLHTLLHKPRQCQQCMREVG